MMEKDKTCPTLNIYNKYNNKLLGIRFCINNRTLDTVLR